jgi:hypothetical protein
VKLLLLYCDRFSFAAASKSLEAAPDDNRSGECEKCVVALIHAEPDDVAHTGAVETKLVKNIKWLAGKFESRQIVLHFFSHLGTASAEPAFAKELVDRAASRLDSSGYQTTVTPFGYFCSLDFAVAGPSLAKVFKQF